MFAKIHNARLDYNENSIEVLNDFINQSGQKFNDIQREQLIDFPGSFLGEVIRVNYDDKMGSNKWRFGY